MKKSSKNIENDGIEKTDNIDNKDSIGKTADMPIGADSCMDDKCCSTDDAAEQNKDDVSEINAIKDQLEVKSKQCDDYFNMLQRTTAEFDNYKKRTAKEKDALYSEAINDAILEFIPVVDNMERAMQLVSENGDKNTIEGIAMVLRQLNETLNKLGVEEIKSVGAKFDPNLHNAVMHIDDDSYDESVVVEEFQKGYMLKDRVIRYSMVKVAN